MTAALTRDADHVYRLAGRRYPGVTEIIAGLGLAMDLPAFIRNDPFYRTRGSAVHACCHLHFQGKEIDWSFPYAEDVVPRYERFLRLVAAEGLKPVLCEEMMVSETFGYAGQLDYFGPCGRHPYAFLDFKGDSLDPLANRLQLAGYKGLVAEKAKGGPLYPNATLAQVLAAPCFIVPLGGSADLPPMIPVCDPDGHDVQLFRGAAALYNLKLSIRGEEK